MPRTGHRVAIGVLVVCAFVLAQASSVSVELQAKTELLAKLGASFAARRLSEDIFTPEERAEILRLQREKSTGNAPSFEEPSYKGDSVFANHDVESAKRMINDVSVIEEKAEVIAGLRHQPEHLKFIDRSEIDADAKRLAEIKREMESVRFSEKLDTSALQQNKASSTTSSRETKSESKAESTTAAKAKSEQFPAAQVAQLFARRRRDVGYQNNYFAQGNRIRERSLFQSKRSIAQKYEDCMACRMIWRQVEMDVANARYVEDVESSFEHNCLDAQKSMIFYKACQDMENDLYAMVDDYMSGEYTVDKMCLRANMCVTGARLGWKPGHRVFS